MKKWFLILFLTFTVVGTVIAQENKDAPEKTADKLDNVTKEADKQTEGKSLDGEVNPDDGKKEAVKEEVKKKVPEKLDEKIDYYFGEATSWFVSTVFFSVTINDTKIFLIVVWLIIATLFCTVYFKFINITGLKHAIRIVSGKEDNNQKESGEVSHFQALCTALSGTVGLGNIAGVAVAIGIGGPGATFWMITAGFLGMATKFVECTLAVKYRKVNEDGSVSGGPMYYLSEGLKLKGMAGFGKFLAVCFAFCCILGSLGGGNMFQANQAFDQLGNTFEIVGDYKPFFGLVLAVIVGIVIIGGIKRIATVTDKIVPFMAGIYIISSLVVIIANMEHIGAAFGTIIDGAFTAPGIKGGFLGVLIAGFQRAAFSNEAGIGSAPIAHSAVKTEKPVAEGFVALLEPFIDTVVICTMTALVIIFSGTYTNPDLQGVALTSTAFQQVIPWFPHLLTVAVFLFAFSTMISWSYYGNKSWNYLFGSSKTSDLVFKVIFCFFIVVGASAKLDSVVGFSDAAIFSMSLFNIIGLYILAPVVKKELNNYLEDKK